MEIKVQLYNKNQQFKDQRTKHKMFKINQRMTDNKYKNNQKRFQYLRVIIFIIVSKIIIFKEIIISINILYFMTI